LLWRFQARVTQNPNAVKRTFQKGTLFVRSKPWSSIHLEPFGEIGKTQSFLELPEGEYTLTLHKEGQSQHRKRLRVRILPKQLTRPLVIFW
jgi:hypothetical protein